MTILNMDPPKHTRYRRLVTAGFTPRMITLLVDRIAVRARRASSTAIEGRDEIEFVEEVAAELPLQMICEMIGVARRRPPPCDLRLEQPARRLPGPGLPHDARKTASIASAEIYAFCDEHRRRSAARTPATTS